jgi:hypothetical protein
LLGDEVFGLEPWDPGWHVLGTNVESRAISYDDDLAIQEDLEEVWAACIGLPGLGIHQVKQ